MESELEPGLVSLLNLLNRYRNTKAIKIAFPLSKKQATPLPNG
jgi:hypothetical protein